MESCDTISNLIDQEEKRQYARQESFDENGEGDMDSQKSFEQRKQKFMEFLFNNRNNAKEETKICNDEFNSNKIHSNKQNRKRKPIKNENMMMNSNDDEDSEFENEDEFDYEMKQHTDNNGDDNEILSSGNHSDNDENETNFNNKPTGM